MTGYDIFHSNGDLLTTINVKTIDEQNNSSLILIGQGIPDYGTAIAQDFIWMLENFAKTTPPVHPLEGQQWYDKAKQRMNFYNGTEWRHYTFPESSLSSKFDMLPAATALDFTIAGTTAIFTGADSGKKYCPTHLFMLPSGAFTATTPAILNLSVTSGGDVLSGMTIPIISSAKFFKVQTNQSPVFIPGTATLNLNITSAASGGQLNYDVYIFGAVF